MKYALVIFDSNSKNFAKQIGIQETNDDGDLIAVYDTDGQTLVSPGGCSGSWTLIADLESDDYWDAEQESKNIDISDLDFV